MANEPDTPQPPIGLNPTPSNKPDFKKVQTKEEQQVLIFEPAQFATEYFQTLGLSVCSKCGSKKQTDGSGKIICVIGMTVKKECPMLDKEGK